MEAGNRCFDQRVPEEINRKIIDHISDINSRKLCEGFTVHALHERPVLIWFRCPGSEKIHKKQMDKVIEETPYSVLPTAY